MFRAYKRARTPWCHSGATRNRFIRFKSKSPRNLLGTYRLTGHSDGDAHPLLTCHHGHLATAQTITRGPQPGEKIFWPHQTMPKTPTVPAPTAPTSTATVGS